MAKINVFKEGVDDMANESFEEKKKQAEEMFKNLEGEDKDDMLRIIRLQSVLISINILDDYCRMVETYRENIVKYIADYSEDKTFIDRVNSIDTFAEKEEYSNRLMEMDVELLMSNQSNPDTKYDAIEMSMLQFTYSHWIEERNAYLDFILTAFENEVDKLAIADIVKNNREHICELISDYIHEHYDSMVFSNRMGEPFED